MNYKTIFAFLPGIFFGIAAMAQAKQLTLDEAIRLSITNSKHLKVANAKIDEAVASVRAARDKQLPDLNVSGSYLRLSSANVSLKTKSDPSAPAAGSTPKVSQAMYGIANLSLPLYAGGRIKYGIESARLLEQATRLDAESDRENVMYNSVAAYVNLYKATQAISVIQENLQASLVRDTTFSRLENNGLLARNDLLKAQLQTSNIELTLLDAENDLALAKINMNLLLGLPENQDIILDSNFVNAPVAIKNFDEYEMLALQNRKDAQANTARVKAAAMGIRSAKAAAYPTIALTGGYIAAHIPDLLTITNAVNVGLGIQYNLASLWKTNTGLKQAKAREQQVVALGEMLSDDIRLNISKDYQDYLLSQKKIDVYERSYQQALENYRITNNKYNNSLVTITDLLDADIALLQAKLNKQFGRADAVLAEKKLLLTAGVLSK
jgi:outer membrane protein TolC